MYKYYFHSVLLVAITSVMYSCKKDPAPVNEEELITTVKYSLSADNGESVIFEFSDNDGAGGQSPKITTTGSFKKSLVYTGNIRLSNESVNPPTDLTSEIEEEANDHQFFYEPSDEVSQKVNFVYDDTDTQGFPLGLKTKVNPLSAGKGKLKITLRHQPDKKAAGVAQGKIQNAGGETDLQIEFDIEIRD